jgi:hypothetical protein
LAACVLPLPAAAAEGSNVHAEARTVTTLQRELDPATPSHTRWRAPTWQFLTLRGRELGGGFDVDASAWLAQELAGDHAPERRGDVVFGSVGWRGWDRKLLVRAGRDFIAAGGARGLVLDGVQATVQLPVNLSLQGYGGWNVTQDGAAFATPVVGARLAWNPWLRGHLGASVQQVGTDDAPVRRSLGLDASLRWTGKRGVEAGIDAQVWQNPWYETQAMALATLALADAALRSPPPPPPKEADDDEDAGPAALPAAATEADE